DGIRDRNVTGVQTCALPISLWSGGLAKKRALEGLLLEIFLAGGVGRFQGRGFRNRDIPPAGAIRCVDKRVGVDVDEGGLVRSFCGSHGLLKVLMEFYQG